jgi:hypothetical protein
MAKKIPRGIPCKEMVLPESFSKRLTVDLRLSPGLIIPYIPSYASTIPSYGYFDPARGLRANEQ